jgi:DNA-binding CsgD family transcriptional regulator
MRLHAEFKLLATPENHRLIVEQLELSKAEAWLALLIADGMTLRAAGEWLGYTENTTRTFVKRALEKLYVHSQPQLVRSVILTIYEQERR